MTNATECPIKECIESETTCPILEKRKNKGYYMEILKSLEKKGLPISKNTIAHTIKTKKPEMSNIEHLERAKAVWELAKELGLSITFWGKSAQRLLDTPEAQNLLLVTDSGEVDFRSSKL